MPACKKLFSEPIKELDCFSRKGSECCQGYEVPERKLMMLASVHFCSGLTFTTNGEHSYFRKKIRDWTRKVSIEGCPLSSFAFKRNILILPERTIASALELYRSIVMKELQRMNTIAKMHQSKCGRSGCVTCRTIVSTIMRGSCQRGIPPFMFISPSDTKNLISLKNSYFLYAYSRC